MPLHDLGTHLLSIILLDLVHTWLLTSYDAPNDRVSGTRIMQRMDGISHSGDWIQARRVNSRNVTSHRVMFPSYVLLSHAFKDAWVRACTLVPISLHIELNADTGAKRQKDGEIMATRMSNMLEKFPSASRFRLQCTCKAMATAILPSISEFKGIRHINLKDTALGDSSVEKLARSLVRIGAHLLGINIQFTRAGNVAIEKLVQCFPELESVACGGDHVCTEKRRRRRGPAIIKARVTTAVFKSLSRLPQLRVIDIEDLAHPLGVGVTRKEVEDSLHVLVQTCKHIEHLRLRYLTCRAMDHIAKFKFLKSLHVEQAGFAQHISSGLTHVIENCKVLQTLKLGSYMLTDKVLQAMAQSQLKNIHIFFCGAAIQHWRLESFAKLKECTTLVELLLITSNGAEIHHPYAAECIDLARKISQKMSNTSQCTLQDTSDDDTELFECEAHLGQLGQQMMTYIKV